MQNREKVLSVHDLKVGFGNHHVLKGINLDVYRGDIVGYIGPNGAGKSTTIKIILGLIENYTGLVEIFGRPLKKGDQHYKRKIGYVPESADMYEQLTPGEYLSFIGTLYGIDGKVAEEKGFHLLRLLGMEDMFHQRIDSFSKGMRQKVLIVSSLLHNPDIIFLDEPLNGLDTNSVSVIKQIFKSLAESGKTFFFSSHIMEVVENLSNRIVLLSDGEIVADGDFTQLKSENQQESLEGIFNQLTHFSNQTDMANDFVRYVVDANEKDGHHA